MGKVDAIIDFEARARPRTPRSTRKVAEAVDRDNRGVPKWRDMESRDQVRPMMLDRVARSPESFARKGLLEQLHDALPLLAVGDAPENQPVCARMRENVGDLPSEMRGT